MKTAIFVDGAFFLKRYAHFFPKKSKNPKTVVTELYTMCIKHLSGKNEPTSELYRIFYYDCPPLMKKVHLPITKKCLDFSKTSVAIFKNNFIDELKQKRKVALRLGRIQDNNGWVLEADKIKSLLRKDILFEDLKDEDFTYGIRQKQIDMKIGLDIASLAYKKLVDRIVLIAGDADFVPVAKLARREGIDFILDPMWKDIPDDLFEHIDGIRTHCPNMKKITTNIP